MNSDIRFSIVIPTFNRGLPIRETINSVLAQDFPSNRTEIILVDDGSTDKTQEILASYGLSIKVLYQSNRGGEAARHLGASAAIGDYIVLLDHDDLLFPWALSLYDRIINLLDAPPIIIGQMKSFRDGDPVLNDYPDNSSIEVYKYNDYLSREIPVGQFCSKVVIKRSVALSRGFFRPKETAWPFDITDMLLLVGDCSPFIMVRRPFSVAYRMHAFNTIRQTNYMVRSFPRLIQLECIGSYPGGKARRFGRRAVIGAMGLHWAKLALGQKKIGLFLWLIWKCFPMAITAILRKFKQHMMPKTPPITLGELSSVKSNSEIQL